MTDCSNKLIRNSTTELLIFTAQAGEQSIAARYVDDIIWQKPTPSKGVQA